MEPTRASLRNPELRSSIIEEWPSVTLTGLSGEEILRPLFVWVDGLVAPLFPNLPIQILLSGLVATHPSCSGPTYVKNRVKLMAFTCQ